MNKFFGRIERKDRQKQCPHPPPPLPNPSQSLPYFLYPFQVLFPNIPLSHLSSSLQHHLLLHQNNNSFFSCYHQACHLLQSSLSNSKSLLSNNNNNIIINSDQCIRSNHHLRSKSIQHHCSPLLLSFTYHPAVNVFTIFDDILNNLHTIISDASNIAFE